MCSHTVNDEPAIRPFRDGDLDAILRITGEVFAPVSIDARIEAMFGRARASWSEIKGQVLRNELSDNPEGCFVAELGGKVVGYITTQINLPASRGVIPNVAVIAAVQGRGLGRRLILRALNHFRGLGLRYAKIETLEDNEVGRRLYPSLGFREVARQVHFAMEL